MKPKSFIRGAQIAVGQIYSQIPWRLLCMGCFGSGRENGKIDPARPGCRACQGKGVHPIPWSELNNAE